MSYRRLVGCALMVFLLSGLPAWSAELAGESVPVTERMMHLVFQLAVVLCAAKIGGTVVERKLRLPAVIGELGAGIVIGPYALGGQIGLFAVPAAGAFPVSPELYGFATVASIVLLYLAGLETDLSKLLRYSLSGTLVGIGGVVASFGLGTAAAVWTGLADGWTTPTALFMGAVSTATSVGITVRILSERRKLDSPEGVTILTGAVVDDVLGIIVLAVVVGVCRLADEGGALAWGSLAMIAGKAVGFWIGCTAAGLLLAKYIGRAIEKLGSRQTMATVSLGLALLLAGISEKAGLAMIIGAFIMGVSLSTLDCAHELRRRLEPLYHTLVAVFFCVLGMMVDLGSLGPVLVPGLAFTALAIVAKLVGCSIPAYATGFNLRGACRIGVGMLPRGEVTMIIAGLGLAMGFLSPEVFGVAVITTLVCTLVAPAVMVRIFDDRSGLRNEAANSGDEQPSSMRLDLPNAETADFLVSRVIQTFEEEGCYVHQVEVGAPIFLVRKDEVAITVERDEDAVVLSAGERDRAYARLVLLEALAGLIKVFQGLKELDKGTDLHTRLSMG